MDQPDLVFNPPVFRAMVLMADAVQVTDGKLFILGGGLGVVGPHPQHISVAIRVGVPWDLANNKHEWSLTLTNEDGQPVVIGGKTIGLHGHFEAGRPPGSSPGSDLWVPLGINFGPLTLERGKRYTWTLYVNGETSEDWSAAFSVLA